MDNEGAAIDAAQPVRGTTSDSATATSGCSIDSDHTPPVFIQAPPPLETVPLEVNIREKPVKPLSHIGDEPLGREGFQKPLEEFATIAKTGSLKLAKLARPAGRYTLFLLRFPIPLKQDHLVSNSIKIPFNLGCNSIAILIFGSLLFQCIGPYILIVALLIGIAHLCVNTIRRNKIDPWIMVLGRHRKRYKVRISEIADVQISNDGDRRPEFIKTKDNKIFKLVQSNLREDLHSLLISLVSNQSNLESAYDNGCQNAGVGERLLRVKIATGFGILLSALLVLFVIAYIDHIHSASSKIDPATDRKVLTREEALEELLVQVDESGLPKNPSSGELAEKIESYLFFAGSVESETFNRAIRKLLELEAPASEAERQLGQVLLSISDSSVLLSREAKREMLLKAYGKAADFNVKIDERPAIVQLALTALTDLE